MRGGCGHHIVVGLEASCTRRHLHLRCIHLSNLRASRPRHRMVPPLISSFFSNSLMHNFVLIRYEGLAGVFLYLVYTLVMAVNKPFLTSLSVTADCIGKLYLINTGRSHKSIVTVFPLLFIYPLFLSFILFSTLFFYVIVYLILFIALCRNTKRIGIKRKVKQRARLHSLRTKNIGRCKGM